MTAMVNAPFLSLSPVVAVRSNNLYLTVLLPEIEMIS
jgi:hypothetical protein